MMQMTTRRGIPQSILKERVEWLLINRKYWVGLEMTNGDCKVLFKAMQQDGLFSKSTYWVDALKGINRAVDLARIGLRKGK